jgi:CubicO group peptidase (beta-lactamase class C family)
MQLERLVRVVAALSLLVLSAACSTSGGEPAALRQLPPPGHVPGAQWETIDPGAAGWDVAALERARKLWRDNSGTSSVMVVHRGAVVAQWGDVEEKRTGRSIRKSLLSSLIGIAVADGKLRLDATVAELGIEDATPLSAEEQRATLADLLASRSGIYIPAAREHSGHRRRRPERGSHPPGTFFYYNNWDFNGLGLIYRRHVAEDLAADFVARIATPIGMEDFRPDDFSWMPEDVSPIPAYDFLVSTRDLARYGLLWARGGSWGDRQLVDAAWVEESTRPITPETWTGSAYGRLWWVQPPGSNPAVPEGLFYAEGGSHLWVLPSRDLVVVHHNRSNLRLLRSKLGMVPDEEQTWEVFRQVVAAGPWGREPGATASSTR